MSPGHTEDSKTPSTEFRQLLYRDLAIASTTAVRDVTRQTLREIVNHGTQAFARCTGEPSGKVDVDVAPLALFHQAIAMTDAIQELLDQVCVRGAVPCLRTLAEASLSLEYILRDEQQFEARSLSWYCIFIHNQLRECDTYDGSSQMGRELAESWNNTHDSPWESLPDQKLSAMRSSYKSTLKQEHFQPIEAEYRSSGTRRPQWYSLFGGPPNLRVLAKQLERLPDYDILYRPMSLTVHGLDLQEIFSVEDGIASFWSIRRPTDLAWVAAMAAMYTTDATRQMLEKYRHGESQSVGRWYGEEIKPSLDWLRESAKAELRGP